MFERLYFESETMDPYVNLATEEFLLKHCGPDQSILYLWQNQHTVVIGKNQNAWKECRIGAIEKAGGHIARRLSGGGAVYHDLGNLNFTFITGRAHYDVAGNMEVIRKAVASFGIDARKTGRNDLEANGHKFSGNAYFEGAKTCYHHGTLMIDVDLSKLKDYLNVSQAKLQSKGVESVRSRVVNLRELEPTITIEGMKEAMKVAFFMEDDLENIVGIRNGASGEGQRWITGFVNQYDGVSLDRSSVDSPDEAITEYAAKCPNDALTNYVAKSPDAKPIKQIKLSKQIELSEQDQAEIQKLAKKYASWDWIFGKKLAFQSEIGCRFDWGEMSLQFMVNGGIIKDVMMYSDALYGNLPEKVPACICGRRYNREDIVSGLKALKDSLEQGTYGMEESKEATSDNSRIVGGSVGSEELQAGQDTTRTNEEEVRMLEDIMVFVSEADI